MASEVGAATRPAPPIRIALVLDVLVARSSCASTNAGLCIGRRDHGRRRACSCLHLLAEGGDGQQVGPKRKVVPSEQGARGDGEILAARFASPARLARRSGAWVANRAAAAWTDGFSIRVGPAQAQEHIVDARVRHPDIRRIFEALSERAAAESKKCCAKRTCRREMKSARSCQRLPNSTRPFPLVAVAT
jgi:hypothetical protein